MPASAKSPGGLSSDDGCRRIKIERNNLLCEQAPTEVFRSIFAWFVNSQVTTSLC